MLTCVICVPAVIGGETGGQFLAVACVFHRNAYAHTHTQTQGMHRHIVIYTGMRKEDDG